MATTTSKRTYADRIVAAVGDRVQARLAALASAGVDLSTLGDPEELAARAAAVIPLPPHAYDLALGPFYDTTGLTRWLDISRQALADRVRRGSVLACRTEDGHLVYPAFQFGRDGSVRPGLIDVLRAFAGHDGWAVAAWLTAPVDALDGHSALDWLALGRDAAVVVRLARADAAGWAA
jgi:hypothetical protein